MEKDGQTRVFQLDDYRKDGLRQVYPPVELGQENKFTGQDALPILTRENYCCIHFQSRRWQRVAGMERIDIVDTWLVRDVPTDNFSNIKGRQQSEERSYAFLARRLEKSSGVTGLTIIAV